MEKPFDNLQQLLVVIVDATLNDVFENLNKRSFKQSPLVVAVARTLSLTLS